MTNLFTYRPPHVRGSATSKAAADSITPTAAKVRERVRVAIADTGLAGMTCDQIEAALDMRHQTASARIVELVNSGAILKTDRTRPTRSGRAAAVYVAKT
jgi:hypothetical protein